MANSNREFDAGKTLRVGLIGPAPGAAGGQSVVAEQLLLTLNKLDGVQVDLLPIDPPLPGPLKIIKKIKYVRTIFNFLVYVVSLMSRAYRYDVLHVMSASYWSFLVSTAPAMLVGRMYRRAVVLNYHSGEADDHFANWRSAKPLTRLATVIAVPSAFLQSVFSRHGLDSVVVSNFVNPDDFSYRRRESPKPRFLCNRSFQAHYNVGCVLDAFRDIQHRFPEAQLTVAGDGPLRASLQNQVQSLGLHNVEFVGAVSLGEMAVLYDKAEVYLNASKVDNMPMSLLEAASSGLPIVSSDAGGIPYMVKNGEEAVLVPSGDCSALAKAAIAILTGKLNAVALADRARDLVHKEYTPAAVVDKWVETYGAALEGVDKVA